MGVRVVCTYSFLIQMLALVEIYKGNERWWYSIDLDKVSVFTRIPNFSIFDLPNLENENLHEFRIRPENTLIPNLMPPNRSG